MSKLDANTRISLSPAVIWAIAGVLFTGTTTICTLAVRATWRVSAVMHEFGQKLDANTGETKAYGDKIGLLTTALQQQNAQTVQRVGNWNPWREKLNFNIETLARATGANVIPLDPPPPAPAPVAIP